MRVVAAMSGGVDSAVAAALLAEAGHEVTGVFLRSGVAPGPRAAARRQGCCGVEDAADAARAADVLGIAFYSLDFSGDFERIVDDFARAYAAGATPNPCIQCNRDLKFGRLLRFADAIGADAVATGHYADLVERGGRRALRIPADRAKDQTYVLFPLPQTALARTLFPLAALTKEATRAEARRRGLPVAEKPESMEICFVPEGDYRTVLARRTPHALVGGDVVDAATGAVLGRHGGVGTVTVGQRRGTGIAAGAPRYVTSVDAPRNVVFVGDDAMLRRREVDVAGWNAVGAETPADETALRGLGKIRRNHAPEPCTLYAGGGRLTAVFDAPVRAPAPGQALVLYDGDGVVLGGGWIAATR